ncbi:hypothetical protein GCM10022198_10080 [Klugiella xanthotipulae]|uniref:Glycosyl transferase family 2 n=1 Tax=Klugiella xanthotipulae TaxID=244735 RepID=A0A543HYH3_9MICO|nr:glycosyltransferase family 2 protein [Klugiella xanthotipulae]TQM63406.1 glycosyl transferase family 2 [Klugiella xanthotipulae]
MKLVATMMVRDEADIVAAMLEHHLAQGVDLIIVTDNGSVDGTREIVSRYADTGRVELHDYREHDKQQSAVVSKMASRAFTEHAADWVINADADEFFIPVDRTLTLREALERIPIALGAFTARVVNMTGLPGRSGSGIDRLTWRDERSNETLARSAGLNAQPTPNAIHVGRADVTVAQGNHFVSIESQGQPEAALALEVLHYPWRSWAQFCTKVENAGLAYEGSPTLRPSPRHHGMRDYRFLKAGILEEFYEYRHPQQHELTDDSTDFVADRWMATSLHDLLDSGRALSPGDLAATLNSPEGEPYTAEEQAHAAEIVGAALPIEVERTEALAREVTERKRLQGVSNQRAQEAEAAHRETQAVYASPDYRIGRAVLAPVRAAKKLIGR